MVHILYLVEVALRLRRSVRAVEWLVATGQLKSGKVGGRRVVRESDLDAYINAAFADGPGIA